MRRSPLRHPSAGLDLTIAYPGPDGDPVPIVSGVSFEVGRGEVVGIVGESGSGKTQTVFALLDLLPRSARIAAGRVLFDGQPVVGEEGSGARHALRQLRGRRIAYIPQEPMTNLDPAFTIAHQLTRPMVKVLGMSRGAARRRAAELLDLVGIRNVEQTLRSYPHELSGGMAQRVLIAGAVSAEPDLLLADEPTTARDVTVQAEVLDGCASSSSGWMALLLATHNFGVVADFAIGCWSCSAARRRARPVRQVLRDPQDGYTRTLLGSMLHGKTPMTLLTGTERTLADLLQVENPWSTTGPAGLAPRRFRAVDHVSFAIGAGRTLGSWAKSGSGRPPSAGHSRADAGDVRRDRVRRPGDRLVAARRAPPA